jgi:two-component system chemotaxis sensor kinase CheA
MHLYRNSMDHGIEPAETRQAAGKPAAGTLRLTAALMDGQLRLRLADDGRGLALGRIRERAEARGLLEAGAPVSDEAIAQLIFAAGFSTAEQVTEVSGRGVGMDAVRSFLQREGGDIRLVFVDDAEGAPYRAFETWVLLPATLAVDTKNRPEIAPPTAARPAASATASALPTTTLPQLAPAAR